MSECSKIRVNSFEAGMIRRILRGENEVFYQLVRPYATAMLSTARSILRNDSDAEDVAQEAVLKAFTNLANFRGDARFSTWLIQITINQSLMRLRKERRQLVYSLDKLRKNAQGEYISRDFADWREIPSEALQKKELWHALVRALNSITPKYREVFVLRDVRHFSIAETAALLGVTKSAVKTRLLRARLQMRDALAPGIDGQWSSGRSEFRTAGYLANRKLTF
jgi:RNA polymerase sigma-70 factor, ECF subfamily